MVYVGQNLSHSLTLQDVLLVTCFRYFCVILINRHIVKIL